MRRLSFLIFPFILSTSFLSSGPLRAGDEASSYLSPSGLVKEFEKLEKAHKGSARLHELAETPGGRKLALFETGAMGTDAPAVMVLANMDGDCPLAGEAALELSRLLLEDWSEEAESLRWYIIPCGNPDGYASFFEKPLAVSPRNARPHNDDQDDATGEDGPDDINGDGYITSMRQVHPEGEWVEVEGNPVLMRKADRAKGEMGKYRVFGEGTDNDGDGRIDEDGPGGVIPGRNFPHNFTHYTTTDGLWPASEEETRAILRFAFDHREIAMVIVFGRSNTLAKVPESSRRAESTQDKYKVPERMARRWGLDPEQEFTVKELVELAKEATGYPDISEDMVLNFLGAGAAVNPDRQDLPYWNEISERYEEFIKEAGLDGKRIDPPAPRDGSVEDWAYYQYGVPAYSVDFWTLPVKEEDKKEDGKGLSPDEIEKMTGEEFIGLGKERIGEILEASGAPASVTADMVIMGLQGGQMTTKRMAEMMRRMQKEKKEPGKAGELDQALYDYDQAAFLDWKEYDHPTLGKVEIGGMVPWSDLAPAPEEADSLIGKQLPFVRRLAGMLPGLSIERVEVRKRSSGVWEIDAWVVNSGFLPYPTYQGKRCGRPAPAAVTIDPGKGTILEGRERELPGLLAGSGGSSKLSWLVQGNEGEKIVMELFSFSAGKDVREITLAEGGGI